MEFKFNTLVISDLHLGEDLGPSATEATRLHIDLVEKQLVNFLRFYSRRREDGRPWRLVINGDMIDFIAITVLPEQEEGVSGEEREFGLRRRPDVARTKLDKVGERHGEFFRGLARFLSRGNRVEIIPGNHDTEFHWPAIQNGFVRLVTRAWEAMPEAGRPGAASAEEVAEAIGFHPWFFYEKGVLWIEHGHQYDDCCSFEHQLYPRQPKSDEIVMNVDAAGARYLTNYVPEAESHQQEDWTFTGYLRFAFGVGYRGIGRLVRGYYKFTASLLSAYRANRRSQREKTHVMDGHFERLRRLADEWSIGEDTLLSLDNLRRRPIIANLRKLLSVLMLDKIVAFVPAILLGLVALLLLGLPWGAVTAGFLLLAARTATWWTGRGRMIDPRMNLQLVSERIRSRVDVRYVVFGHTHVPVARQLDDGGWYYNTGTWVPSGKPGLLRAFSHFVLRHGEGGPVAQLCQWRDGASRPFTPEWRGARDEAAEGALAGEESPEGAEASAV